MQKAISSNHGDKEAQEFDAHQHKSLERDTKLDLEEREKKNKAYKAKL
tara:strand:- start:200 stop:343 length:144 start_codon:yes stop_codon:yes gene_type:complete